MGTPKFAKRKFYADMLMYFRDYKLDVMICI